MGTSSPSPSPSESPEGSGLPIDVIAAVDAEGGIGREGGLPWRLSADLRRFRTITTTAPVGRCNAVVMGRRTWESLPPSRRPLPGRINVVLTRSSNDVFPPDVLVAPSFPEALRRLETMGRIGRVFAIGGRTVFAEALPLCRCLRLTHIHATFACDVFFPWDPAAFRRVRRSPPQEEGGLHFFFAEYVPLPAP